MADLTSVEVLLEAVRRVTAEKAALEADIATLREERRGLQADRDLLLIELEAARHDIADIKANIPLRAQELAELQAQASTLQTLISRDTERLAVLRREIEYTKADLLEQSTRPQGEGSR